MISPSSATRKSGSRPISLKWFRIRNRLKLSIVVICALCNSADCFWICSLPGSASSLAVMPAAIRSRISAAAALVNVTISSLSISTGCSPSQIMRMIRSTNTAVLPLPAAADTRILLLCSSITLCCSGVNFIPIYYLCS